MRAFNLWKGGGVAFAVIAVFLFVAAASLKDQNKPELVAPIQLATTQPLSLSFSAVATGGHAVYLRRTRKSDDLPSDFLNSKTPPFVSCDLLLIIKDSRGAVILNTNCNSLTPSIWKGDSLYYSLAGFEARASKQYSLYVENKVSLNRWNEANTMIVVSLSSMDMKNRLFWALVAQVGGYLAIVLGIVTFVLGSARRTNIAQHCIGWKAPSPV